MEDVDLLPGISVADDDGYWVDVTLGGGSGGHILDVRPEAAPCLRW